MADYEKLMMQSALHQLEGKMNYKILAQDLGLGNDANAAKKANMRWLRFRAKLLDNRVESPAATRGSKRASPEKRPASSSKSTQSGSPTKKSKVKASDIADQEEMQIKTEDGTAILETPTRRGTGKTGRGYHARGHDQRREFKFQFPDLEYVTLSEVVV